MTEVAVVGAGLMGHALALVFALGGHQVRLTDTNVETLERAPGLMATALATLIEAGEVDTTWDRQRLSHAVRCVPSLAETVTGAKLVVEAVVERPDVKRADAFRARARKTPACPTPLSPPARARATARCP